MGRVGMAIVPAWVRFWWRHLMWTPMAFILGGIALQTAQGFAELVLRAVGTESALAQANQIAATPSWVLSYGMIVFGVGYWMRNVHQDFVDIELQRDRLSSLVGLPQQRLVAAKDLLRKQAMLMRIGALICDRGTLTIETDRTEIPADVLGRHITIWVNDTYDAVEKALGEIYAHEFTECLGRRNESMSPGDRFRSACQFLLRRIESINESDIDPSFDPTQRLATIEKLEVDDWIVRIVDEDTHIDD